MERDDVRGQGNLLRIVQKEAQDFFTLVEAPENWKLPTAAGHWQVCDIVAHLVDTTEGYSAFRDNSRWRHSRGHRPFDRHVSQRG